MYIRSLQDTPYPGYLTDSDGRDLKAFIDPQCLSCAISLPIDQAFGRVNGGSLPLVTTEPSLIWCPNGYGSYRAFSRTNEHTKLGETALSRSDAVGLARTACFLSSPDPTPQDKKSRARYGSSNPPSAHSPTSHPGLIHTVP